MYGRCPKALCVFPHHLTQMPALQHDEVRLDGMGRGGLMNEQHQLGSRNDISLNAFRLSVPRARYARRKKQRIQVPPTRGVHGAYKEIRQGKARRNSIRRS